LFWDYRKLRRFETRKLRCFETIESYVVLRL
jgi:hypothetical protein